MKTAPPPLDWGVSVQDQAIAGLAKRLANHRFPQPSFDYPGAPAWTGSAWCNFCLLGVSVVWCLWPPRDQPVWRTRFNGDWLEDAPGIWACFARAFPSGIDTGDIPRPERFFDGVGTLQMIQERGRSLADAAEALRTHWDGSAINLLEDAGFEATESSDRLIDTIPGFLDRSQSPVGILVFDKLAHLAVAMMAARSPLPITGLERFPVFPDYMLPRHLRHKGILAYTADLAAAVDGRILIPEDSPWEYAIRWATVYAGNRLCNELAEMGNPVTTPQLDYYLWWEAVLGPNAGSMGEHHRTVTKKY